MKASEVRQLSQAELEARVKEYKAELFNLRFQKATGQLENPLRIKHIKKDIARIQTILREREIESMKA